MAIALGSSQYGKAETRVVRIVRDTPRHEIVDLNVTTALRGDFADAHVVGDQAKVLPTDTQKNTAFAYAKEHGIASVETYGLALARHFVADVEFVTSATVEIEQYGWSRVVVDGAEHDHTWVRSGEEVRTAAVTAELVAGEMRTEVHGGLKDLVILKSTGSQFRGFLRDRYTTLPETDDRVLATSLAATWRFGSTDVDWGRAYRGIKAVLLREFATVHSLALQQTLWHMGRAVLEEFDAVTRISLRAPNRHHFLVDLRPFGLDNPGEVFHAADRPYGLIEATVVRQPEA
ncbi:factor-independent urate hydroxylase [Georgenia sp. AZ-5]|uniref:factor-independent urate hydroxylase n=1 Tax=Georgenia sp. AZ-5 TaxID=3367526 RepID=UPI003754FEBF